jgi:glucose/mannose-6-phosphate isomerase
MNLDNQSTIKKLDKNNVAASIANLPKQLIGAYNETKKTKLPPTFAKAKNIIFCGMGGSNLASELIKKNFEAQIKVPMALIRDYNLPTFASKDSLIIVDSYSGNTEEAISCLNQALTAKARIIVIASGGQLELLAKKNKLAYFKLNPSLNPSGQPRYDVGSQLGVALNIFSRLKFIKLDEKELTQTASALVSLGFNLMPSAPIKNNIAKQLAKETTDKNIYILGAQYLSANAHILANQINESAKQLASPYQLPELNHHFLEALTLPKKVIQQTCFILLLAPDYSEQIGKRFVVTKKILNKQSIKTINIKTEAKGNLNQALEILTYGSWLSFYLAMLNNVNPAEIPWVNLFKKELEK